MADEREPIGDETPSPEDREVADEAAKQIADKGGADDLVAQMRQARSEGAGLPALGAKPKRRRPPTGHARAATHLGFKKAMWMPAMLVGAVCLAVGIGSLVTAVLQYGSPPELPGQQILYGPDGRAWAIGSDATGIHWENGVPVGSLAGGYEDRGKLASEDRDFARYLAARERATGFLIFGVALLAVGAALVALSLWMRWDVKLVAAAAAPPPQSR